MVKGFSLFFILTSCVFLIQSNKAFSQNYPDTIVTKKSDIIVCRIIVLDARNVFYFKKNKRKAEPDSLALDAVQRYAWHSKDIPASNHESFPIPFDSTSKLHVGVKLNFQLNYPLVQESVLLSLYFKGHNLFVGPEYIQLLEESLTSDLSETWEQQYPALSFGYRYLSKSWNTKTNIYAQTSFSIFKGKYTQSQNDAPFVTTQEPVVVLYTFGLGANYKLNKNSMIYSEIGFCSHNQNQSIPFLHFMVGVEYRFGK